jgi:hypothetical protein
MYVHTLCYKVGMYVVYEVVVEAAHVGINF